MFIKELDNKDKVWLFTLVGGSRIVGQVKDHALDAQGHLMMLQVTQGASSEFLLDIPWHSVLHVEQLVV